MYILIGIAVFIVVVIAMALVVLREYERAVVFTLGRFTGVKGPGLMIIIPIIQQYEKITLRTIVMDVPSQDVISRDNVSVKVNAVVYFRVVDSQKSILQVEDHFSATGQLAQTTLRSVLGGHDLDDILSEREQLNESIRKILDEQSDGWGVKVSQVEIKHVDLNENMVRAIARQAEAERERRSKIILAEGEMQASQKLLEAAKVLAGNSNSMQLRYLQTLSEIAGERSNTIVFPMPGNLLDFIMKAGTDKALPKP